MSENGEKCLYVSKKGSSNLILSTFQSHSIYCRRVVEKLYTGWLESQNVEFSFRKSIVKRVGYER